MATRRRTKAKAKTTAKAKGKASTKARASRRAPTRAGVARGGAAGGAAALAFNHAMLYVADVARSLAFYRDALGFRVVDEYPGAYARVVAPAGGGTLALHPLEPGQSAAPAPASVRLYFEVKALDAFCAKLAARGVVLAQLPQDMPWGWRHAYLRDPDGHELSLYWAGAARLRRTQLGGAGDR